jgi:ABC-type transporter Mla subunit MlaD
MRQLRRPAIALALVLGVLVTQGQMCSNKSAERKLLESQDTAAKLIEKAEQVRTDLLNTPQPVGIVQATATNIDRWLLKINTNIKRLSASTDKYAANPAIGTGDVKAAIAEGRQLLEDFKASVRDGSLGIRNANSQQSVVAVIDSLKSVLSTVENAVGEISRRKS